MRTMSFCDAVSAAYATSISTTVSHFAANRRLSCVAITITSFVVALSYFLTRCLFVRLARVLSFTHEL